MEFSINWKKMNKIVMKISINNKMIWLIQNKQIKKYKIKQMSKKIKIKYLIRKKKKFYFNLKNKVRKNKNKIINLNYKSYKI